MKNRKRSWARKMMVALSAAALAACQVQPGPSVGATTSEVCGSTTLTANPPNGVQLGQTVTFTLTPSCAMGDSPEWQLYAYGPSGGWVLLHDWTTSLTWNWDTSSGVYQGQYQFEAHVRAQGTVDAGTGAQDGGIAYDSYGGLAHYSVNPASACTAVTAAIAGTGVAGTPVTITANGSCPNGGSACATQFLDGCPEYRFYIRPFGGTWQVLQDWGQDNTATFIGNDSAVHTGGAFGNNNDYRIEVDVRSHNNGNTSYDSWTEVDWNYTSAGSCPAGTSVCDVSWCVDTQTNAANCGACQGPYPTYAGLCPATSPTCSAGSCGAGGTCATVSGSATPPSGSVGNTITLAGNATCSGGSTPIYQFWVQPPGQSWQLLRSYGATSTYDWNTVGLSPGTYGVEIDAKATGSHSQYESWSYFTVNLSGSTSCSSVTASMSPSGQAAGNLVTISAVGSCGAAIPEYRYWTQPPGGSWTLLRDWSTSATANFIGNATGPYRVEVDARAQGNGNTSYDSWTEPSAYYYTAAGSCPANYSTCGTSLCNCGSTCGPITTCGGATPTCGGSSCI